MFAFKAIKHAAMMNKTNHADQLRGHSTTTYTDFWLFLTPHLSFIDGCRHLGNHPPLVYVDILKMITLYQKNLCVTTFAQKNETFHSVMAI